MPLPAQRSIQDKHISGMAMTIAHRSFAMSRRIGSNRIQGHGVQVEECCTSRIFWLCHPIYTILCKARQGDDCELGCAVQIYDHQLPRERTICAVHRWRDYCQLWSHLPDPQLQHHCSVTSHHQHRTQPACPGEWPRILQMNLVLLVNLCLA